LKDRLLGMHVHDLSELTQAGRDLPWGTGAGKIGECLDEIRRLGLKPTLFGVGGQAGGPGFKSGLAENISFFNKASLELAKRNVSK
jgi:hypothetical protein